MWVLLGRVRHPSVYTSGGQIQAHGPHKARESKFPRPRSCFFHSFRQQMYVFRMQDTQISLIKGKLDVLMTREEF